ncbi:hypothetical protein, partial [Blautia acetigignens]
WRLAKSYQTGFPPVIYLAPNWRTPPPCSILAQSGLIKNRKYIKDIKKEWFGENTNHSLRF